MPLVRRRRFVALAVGSRGPLRPLVLPDSAVETQIRRRSALGVVKTSGRRLAAVRTGVRQLAEAGMSVPLAPASGAE